MKRLIPWNRIGPRIAARYPLVWRTQLPIGVSIGLIGVALAWLLGTQTEVSRSSLIALEEALWRWDVITSLLVVGAALLVFNQVRRARPLYALSHIVTMAMCCFASTVAILLPPSVWIREMMPRIAALENHADFIALHRSRQFWRCFDSPKSLENAVAGHDELLHRDLARYGLVLAGTPARPESALRTDDLRLPYLYDSDCLGYSASNPRMSLQAFTVPGATPMYGNDMQTFEQRLTHVEAAQQYLTGEGRYADAFLSHLSEILGLSVLLAIVGALGTATSGLQRKASGFLQIRIWDRRGFCWLNRTDVFLASRWPSLWSARVHAAIPELLLIFVVFLYAVLTIEKAVAQPPGPDTQTLSMLGVAWFLWPLLLLRPQRIVRGVTPSLSHDSSAYVLQFMLLALACVIAISGPLGRAGEFNAAFRMIFLSVVVCAAVTSLLQVGRSIPAIQTTIAWWLAAACVFLGIVMSDALLTTFIDSVDVRNGVGIISLLALLGLLARLASKSERYPGTRAALAATWSVSGPYLGLGIALLIVHGDPDAIGWSIILGLILITPIVVLATSRNARIRAGFLLR